MQPQLFRKSVSKSQHLLNFAELIDTLFTRRHPYMTIVSKLHVTQNLISENPDSNRRYSRVQNACSGLFPLIMQSMWIACLLHFTCNRSSPTEPASKYMREQKWESKVQKMCWKHCAITSISLFQCWYHSNSVLIGLYRVAQKECNDFER